MSTNNPPAIPPRPSRSPNNLTASNPSVPKIPPRPTSRNIGRSASPQKDRFAPSPLNEPPAPSGLTPTAYLDDSGVDSLSRPESVELPSVGQEGMGYDNLDSQSGGNDKVEQPAETRNIQEDLHLHAPRPSLPTPSANAKVQAVTRIDSQTNTAGSESPDNTRRPVLPQTRPRKSQRDSSNASSDQRKSLHHDDEHGIPEIGQRVPMYPNAGDVQAPSTSPGPETIPHGDSRHPGSHGRNKSSREASLPPGSYGLHGHGVQSKDPFEKAWYDKHPKELAREEESHYGPSTPRPEGAMSSDKLNEIVKPPGNKGTDLEVMGPPDEEIGNIATEELASRFASPQPSSPLRRESHTSQPTIQSPLQKENILPHTEVPEGESHGVELHINEPLHHQHHPDGFAPGPDATKLPEAGTNATEEKANDVSILASDEIEPDAVHMEPAVSPPLEQQKPGEHKSQSRPTSASSNKRTSGHPSSPSLPTLTSPTESDETKHLPIEDVVEHDEPLFPEDDNQKLPLPAQQSSLLPQDQQQQRFSSKDIWEGAPSSSQLQSTMTTPDTSRHPKGEEAAASLFETPEKEAQRTDKASQLTPESGVEEVPSSLENHKDQEHDPKQRFPSNDIWEEAPQSQQLTAAVQTPEKPASPEKPTSPEIPRKPSIPNIPARPARQPQRTSSPEKSPPKPTTLAQPTSPTMEMKKPPTIPGRPKPQVPSRPARPIKRDSEEGLTRTTSRGSNDNPTPPATKPKPPIPSRPAGSKIAALKAGFLSDLNNQLKLGPQGPKPKEKEEPEQPAERVPLSDARKGRARGPQRRRPAKPAMPAASEQKPGEKATNVVKIAISEPWSVWSMDASGQLTVTSQTRTGQSPEIKDIPAEAPAKIDVPGSSPETSTDVKDTPVEPATKSDISPNSKDASAVSPPKLDTMSPEPTAPEKQDNEIERQVSEDSNRSSDSNFKSTPNDEPTNDEPVGTETQQGQPDSEQQPAEVDSAPTASSSVTTGDRTLVESKSEPAVPSSPQQQQRRESQEPETGAIETKAEDVTQTEIKEDSSPPSSETNSPELSKSTES